MKQFPFSFIKNKRKEANVPRQSRALYYVSPSKGHGACVTLRSFAENHTIATGFNFDVLFFSLCRSFISTSDTLTTPFHLTLLCLYSAISKIACPPSFLIASNLSGIDNFWSVKCLKDRRCQYTAVNVKRCESLGKAWAYL
jgi:hypothetical protein